MIKAAPITLSLVLLLGASFPISAQPTADGQIAGEEAVRRQADVIRLRKLLEEAKKTHEKGDLVAAARQYEEAYDIVQRVGVSIEVEEREAVAGLASVRLELAEKAQRRGDLNEANTQVSRVLRVDPRNQKAQDFKRDNDRKIEDSKGKVASKEVLDRVPDIKEERVAASTLVQDARVLIEMGKLDEAEAKLKEAIKRVPEHTTAAQYMNMIQEAKYQQEARMREISSRNALLQVEQAWNIPATQDRLPQGNPYARTNLVFTGPGRNRINQKLDKILLNEVVYDGLPLSEVVKNLTEESRARDPEKRGINFIINPNVDIPVPQAQIGAVDPITGQPIPPPAPAEPIDLNNVTINLRLRDVRLLDVIDAVSKVAERPLRYNIEEYAVVFTQRGTETAQLFTRVFNVDPNTFVQGLESVSGVAVGVSATGGQGGGGGGGGGGAGGGAGQQGSFFVPRVDITGLQAQQGGAGGVGGGGGGGVGGAGGQTGIGLTGITRTNLMQSVTDMVRNFFVAAGIDFNTNAVTIGANGLPQASGKALFFNDRQGIIFARATLEELDIMEKAIQVLNMAPPQVKLEARFVEISQSDTKALGFDWFLGNTLMNGGRMGLQGGTAPSYSGTASPANPNGVFPGGVGDPVNGIPPTTLPISPTDQLVSGGLRTTTAGNVPGVPAIGTLTGILTDPQFRLVVRALEQRGGIDVLSAPSVTTLSGRQAKIEVTELRTIVAGQSFNQTATGGQAATGVGGVGGVGTIGGGGVGNASQFQTQTVPLGPVLDVIPYVSADGYSVQMTIMPTITEFLGYDDPGQFVPQAQAVAGNTLGTPITAVLPLPKFRVRQVITSAIVWDGQTVALGGLISEDVAKLKDKIPVLGDIPLLGRFFRSESMSSNKKNLVIFVTPTIIDPAGNRVHTEDNLPFDPNVTPPQVSVAP